MRNMKRFIAFLMLFVLAAGVCHADIIQPYGEGQIGLTAVVLCSNLTVRKDRSASSEAVTTLNAGARFMVQNQVDGWADCFLSDDVDGGCSGWVNADYVVVDPAWYRTNGATAVYAWNDTKAPRVGLLDDGEMLPILKDDGDWLVVGLRGAAGWILKTDADKVSQK